MTDCPRKRTNHQRPEDRPQFDAPELDDLLELERAGLVTSKLITFDEQSSALKFTWKKETDNG